MNIVVLCGGLSPERDVSLSSGRRAAEALRSLGHRAVLVDMYFGLEGYDGPLDAAFDLPLPEPGAVGTAGPDLEAVRSARAMSSASLFGERVLELCGSADLVFLALHGQCGEDGRVQAAFDLLGIRYTGSGYLASALAMNKHAAKLIVRSIGLRTADWRYFHGGELSDPAAAAAGLPVPCVVKPVDSGSSLGVEIVRDRAGLIPAIENAARSGSGVLAEDFISGREIQISVLSGRALPSIEIRPGDGFYGYREKYQPGAAVELSPAPIPPEAERELAACAVAAYKALGLKSLARADFILDGEGRFWFLEFNTLPGLTPTSLAPQEAAAAGMTYEELCAEIVNSAFEEDEK